METIQQDLRYALRQMRRAPGFTLMTVLTLALGVGAATAVFSVMDAMLIRPLPYDHPERILATITKSASGYNQPFSNPDFQDLRNSVSSLEALAGYETGPANLELPSGAVLLDEILGSDNYFQVFGVKPLLGRTFVRGEDQAGHNDIAVLSYDVWQNRFNRDPGVVGRAIGLDGHPTVIVGVMPAGFRFPLWTKEAIYTPFHNERKTWATNRGSHWMRSIARLKPGTTRQQAEAEFQAKMADLARVFPDTDAGRKGSFQSLSASIVGETEGSLWALTGAVCALLLIACVNVAGLLLARAVKREREVALRAAVGASRVRLLRQIGTEALLLAACSSVTGVALAYALLAAMRTYLITALARGAEVHLNLPVLLGAVCFAFLTSMAASLLPALKLAFLEPNRVLKAGGNAGTRRGQNRLRAGFIVAQVTLSLVLLVVASLLLQTISRARNVELGFDAPHILALELDLSPGRYVNRDPVATFFTPFLEQVRHLPGVQGAGVISIVPVQQWGSNMDINIVGRPPYADNVEMLAETRIVSAGYFEAMGIHLTEGRQLSDSLDRFTEAHPGGVVNEAFRRKFFSSGGSPVGAQIADSEKTGIVGVMSSVRQNLAVPPMAELDWLMNSIPLKERIDNLRATSLLIRSSGDPKQLIPGIREALHDADPTVPMREAETMTEIMGDQLVMQRMEVWLFGVFAGIAVLLAMAGLYGLVSHEVETGTRDIGVRMALGSSRIRVMRTVLQRVSLLVSGGALLGLTLTYATRKVFASVVELQSGRDGLLLGALALLLCLLGVAAAILPARRAASVEPMQALRSE